MAIKHSLAHLALETVRLAEGRPDRTSLIQPLHPQLALPYAVARTHLLTTSAFQHKRPFGVFVTITHSKAATTKVHGIRSSDEDMRHYQVRGCLGHWNGASNPCEYTPYASADSLLSQIVTLSCQALRHDSRTHPFTQAGVQVCADPGAGVHVTLLQLPLYRIDVNTGTVVTTGKRYTHRTDGILARVQHTHVATFLPNVFPTSTFNTIRDALVKKATGSDKLNLYSELELYGYAANVHTRRVEQRYTLPRLREPELKAAMVKCTPAFTTAFKEVPSDCVPHTLPLPRSGKWMTTPTDDVRNVASTCDAWHLSTVLGARSDTRPLAMYMRKRVRGLCVQFVVQYQRDALSRQASVFLLMLLRLLHREKEPHETIERRLWDSLETMEPTFEQPEAFVVLAQRKNSVMCRSNLQALRTILVQWLRTWEGNTASEEDVFACNWQMQCLHALAVHKITMGPVQKSLYTRLLCRLLSCSTTYDTRTETNYLAVAFEGLCAALGVLKQMDGHEGTQIRLAVQGVLLPLLHTRFSQPHGVYCFTNGAARLDITGHVLSGYRYLRQSACQTRVKKSTRKQIHRKPRASTHYHKTHILNSE